MRTTQAAFITSHAKAIGENKKGCVTMISEAKKKANARYDKAHTKQIILKLNRRTDDDILKRLDQVGNRQGYIKSLIRKDIE